MDQNNRMRFLNSPTTHFKWYLFCFSLWRYLHSNQTWTPWYSSQAHPPNEFGKNGFFLLKAHSTVASSQKMWQASCILLGLRDNIETSACSATKMATSHHLSHRGCRSAHCSRYLHICPYVLVLPASLWATVLQYFTSEDILSWIILSI